MLLLSYLIIFGISMVPVIELRGAIPIGVGLGVVWWQSLLIALAGNILIIAPILLLGEKILNWCTTWKYGGKFFTKILAKSREKAKKISSYEVVGLILFVGIPLPGTGAWTGCVIASILQLPFKKAFFAITVGVLIAAAIITIITVSGATAFNFLVPSTTAH